MNEILYKCVFVCEFSVLHCLSQINPNSSHQTSKPKSFRDENEQIVIEVVNDCPQSWNLDRAEARIGRVFMVFVS